jgi:hypothetical protein
MYTVSEELAPPIEKLGLERNLDDLRQNGYTIIAVDRGLSDRLRAPILRAVEDAPGPNASFDRPPGSVVLWDGAVWHGNYPRTEPGERVVFHATYTRLAYRPVHDFSYLGDDFRASASAEMRALLGENLGFETNSRFQHIDQDRYLAMVLAARR